MIWSITNQLISILFLYRKIVWKRVGANQEMILRGSIIQQIGKENETKNHTN